MDILKNRGKYTICIGLITMLLSTSTVFGLDHKATVIVPKTTIMQERNFNSKQLDKLKMGDKITVKEILDDWYRIEIPNCQNEGWIPSQDVVINGELPKKTSIRKGCVTASVLNVRLGPSTSNARIAQIRCGETVTIINVSGTPEKWYEVILSNNVKGWVHSDYIKITYNFPKGSVNIDSIMLKQQPNSEAACITKLKKDETVYIKDYVEGWYNVISSIDTEGWVENKNITVLSAETINVNRSGSNREIFNDIDTITLRYLGKKYAYGGNGPNSFDCSGFTSYILKTYYGEYLKFRGIDLPRTASTQATVGIPVNKNDLQKGDLVFFDTVGKIGDNISHVGIYIGNGKIVHASTSRKGIVTDNLSDRYYSTRFMKAIRL